MDSKNGDERESIISYNAFFNNVHGGIIPPPPPPAWASATNDDDVIPRDVEMAAVPDHPLDTSAMTRLPSSNDNDALIATCSANAPSGASLQASIPPPHLLEHALPLNSSSTTHVAMDTMKTRPLICDERPGDEEEKEEEAENNYAPLPPETIAASFEAAKTKLIEENENSSVPPEQIPAPCERLVDEEEKEEEAEDDYAPLPPKTIAASFEAAKPELIEDNDDASVPPQQIAAPCERPDDEEEKEEEAEDDYAPLPPETIASSFEAPKPELIENNDDTSVPPGQIPAPCERPGDEEAKEEETEDDYAPLPPEMIAVSYEMDHDANQKGPKNSEAIEGNVGTNINSMQDVISLFCESVTIMPENGTDSLPEILDNIGTPVLSELQPSLISNDQVSVLSMTPTPQRGLNTSLPDHVRMTIYPTPQLRSGSRPSFDPSHQSLPLLEATLVQDVPEEPVYDAIPIDATQDKYAHGWSTRARKYRYIILGLLSITMTAIIAVVVVASQPPAASSVWKRQDQAIIGTDAGDLLGWAVALSADARTLVVGAPGVYANDIKRGYVEVNYKDDMMGLVQSFHGVAFGDLFGYSVDITANGKILAIGSPGWLPNFDRPGYVRVYHLESTDDLGSSWKQLGQNITGEAIGDMFGNSVSLSDDGKTLAVGAYLNGEEAGHVQIYRLDDDFGSWQQLGQDIVGEDPGDNLGHSLSLSADGTTVAIGAPYNSANGEYTGHVKVYRFDSDKSSWEQLGQTIQGEVELDNSGYSVVISADGKYLAVGFSGYTYFSEPDRPGYVRVYHLESGIDDLGSSWMQLGQNITGEGIGDNFGASVSLSDDAKTLAVGADYNSGRNGNYSGHVRVYRYYDSNSSWTQIGEDIDGEAAKDYSGFFCISLSGDGKKLAIGSHGNDSNGTDSGQVRIFTDEG